jgi:predicted Zn-dependent protease
MKRYHPVVSIVLMSFVLACSSSDSPESVVDKARTDIDQHEVVLAQKELEKALADNPGSSEIRYQLARTVEAQGLIYDALHQYVFINSRDPLFAPAFESAARMLDRLGDGTEALNRAHSCADIRKEDPDAHLLVARMHLRHGDRGRARSLADDAVRLGLDKAVAQLVRAEAMLGEARFDSAEAVASPILATKGSTPLFHRQAADYLEAVGLIDSSVAFSRRSLPSKDPDDVFLNDHFQRLLRVGYFWESGRLIDSLESLNRPPTLIAVLRLQMSVAADQAAEAKDALTELAGWVPLNLTRLMYELLSDAVSRNILTIEESAASLTRYLSQRDFSDDFKRIMAWQIAFPAAQHGEQMSGLEYIQLIRGQQANLPEVRLTHTELLFKTGRFDQGFKQLETLHRFHKTSPVWLTGMAQIARNHDTIGTDRAITYYREALAKDEWYRPAFEGLVDLYREQRQFDKALKLFDQHSRLAQRYPAMAVLRSIVLAENKQADRAMRLFSQSIPQVRGDLRHWHQMQFVLERHGFPSHCKQLASLAAQLNEDNVEALMFSAVIAAQDRNADRLRDLATQASKTDADDPQPQAMQAFASYLGGDVEGAAASFEDLLARHRDNPFVLTYYSRMLAETGQNAARAGDMARMAMFGYESDFNSRVNLCYVYYHTGRYDLCLGEANKGIAEYRDHFLPYYWAGKAGAELRRADAAENLRKAIDLGLWGERLSEARTILARL